ncbi:hypothetical protein AB0H03_20745 [Streptomyces sparsogenes]|uniref:hypothetical protein n=1 Tax=Streptomyces sparsogenes TaxID=67365 RepID=UPI0033C60BEE
MTGLTAAEYRTLLTEALDTAQDADTTDPGLRTLFTPSSHRRALDPDVTVVRGARGTGKTYWAKALTDPRLREIAAASYMMPRLGRLKVVTGFGKDEQVGLGDPAFPGRRTIARLISSGVSPEDLWSAVVLTALGVPKVLALDGWADRIHWTRDNPEAYEQALRKVDRETRERGQTLILLFDALDHLHADRRQADLLVSGLFQVALELRLTTSTLRAKIFVRPDMYDSAPKAFADASKLGANAADLTWSSENLYGLLFHQMGNHTSTEAATFRVQTGTWNPEGEGRFVAPVDVIADEKRQKEVFVAIAGPFMGTDRRKGHTYTWVPNHLQDGCGRVSPRTWLFTICRAASVTQERYGTHASALHYDAIRDALHAAAGVRVAELKEDIGWAAVAVEQLKGAQVPMEPSVVDAYWRQNGLSDALRTMSDAELKGSGPRDAENHYALIKELVQLGVMTERSNGAVDLPDVYRLAFDIGRKGGVPRKPVR